LGSFRIVEWAINQATLEDVFVRVAQDYLWRGTVLKRSILFVLRSKKSGLVQKY
jgi:hypothetical protein